MGETITSVSFKQTLFAPLLHPLTLCEGLKSNSVLLPCSLALLSFTPPFLYVLQERGRHRNFIEKMEGTGNPRIPSGELRV